MALLGIELSSGAVRLETLLKSKRTTLFPSLLLMSLQTTLRGHEHPVTVLQFVYLPSGFTAGSVELLKCSLCSADEAGNIVWWDLGTRRPMAKWKAHDKNILLMEQLGISWNVSQDGSSLKPSFTNFYGLLMTHSRDNTMKLWDLKTQKEVHSSSINALNFCNIAVRGQLFACLSKIRPENFDIFEIIQDGPLYIVEPLFENIDLQLLLDDSGIKNDVKVEKLGIIMRLKWVGPTSLAVGLESGHVIVVSIPLDKKLLLFYDDSKFAKLEEAIDEEDLKSKFLEIADGNVNQLAHLMYGNTTSKSGIQVISASLKHFPNPVIDICGSFKDPIIYSTSTGQELVECELGSNEGPVKMNSNVLGVHSLKSIGGTLDMDLQGTMGIGFWNGQVKFYRIIDGHLEKLSQKIEKKKAFVDKEFSANPHDPEFLENAKQTRRFKLNTVKFLIKQSLKPLEELEKGFKAQDIRELLDFKRFLKQFAKDWVAIGYGDGLVGVYERLTSTK